jgi:hypothetical protein
VSLTSRDVFEYLRSSVSEPNLVFRFDGGIDIIFDNGPHHIEVTLEARRGWSIFYRNRETKQAELLDCNDVEAIAAGAKTVNEESDQ